MFRRESVIFVTAFLPVMPLNLSTATVLSGTSSISTLSSAGFGAVAREYEGGSTNESELGPETTGTVIGITSFARSEEMTGAVIGIPLRESLSPDMYLKRMLNASSSLIPFTDARAILG